MKILSNREGVEGREVKMILRNGEGGGAGDAVWRMPRISVWNDGRMD